MRVRAFTQDDGHIFCTEDQIQSGGGGLSPLLQKVYKDFGFTDIIYKLSTTRPGKRIGTEESWDRAEAHWPKPARHRVVSLSTAGRRRLLRPQDRIHAQRRHGTPVAVRHDPGRFSTCRSAWMPNCGRRRRTPPSHHAAPRHRGQPGAFHRHPDRAAFAGALPHGWRRCRSRCSTSPTQADYVVKLQAAKALPNQDLRVETGSA